MRLDEARKVADDEVSVGGELGIGEGGVHERADVGGTLEPDKAVAVDRAAVLELRREGDWGEGKLVWVWGGKAMGIPLFRTSNQ